MSTFSAGIPLPVVLGLNVIFQIACGSRNMFTVITFEFKFFMFCLFMDLKTLLACCFVIAFSAIVYQFLLRVCIDLRLVHFSGRAPGRRLRTA